MAQVTTVRAPAAPRVVEQEMLEQAGRFAALLRSVPDGATRLPGMRWTVGELGAHVAQSAQFAIDVAEGTAESPYPGFSFNAEVDEKLVAALPERNPARLADLVETRYSALAEALAAHPDNVPMDLPVHLSPAGLRAILMLDFLLHGTQIAMATGQPYAVPAETMRTGIAAVLPFLTDSRAAEGFTATYSLRFRGARPLVYGFDNGRLFVDDGTPRRIDCHISADATSFLLQSIGLIPMWRVALTRKVVSYGRKPWLSLRIPKLVPAVPHGGVARN